MHPLALPALTWSGILSAITWGSVITVLTGMLFTDELLKKTKKVADKLDIFNTRFTQ